MASLGANAVQLVELTQERECLYRKLSYTCIHAILLYQVPLVRAHFPRCRIAFEHSFDLAYFAARQTELPLQQPIADALDQLRTAHLLLEHVRYHLNIIREFAIEAQFILETDVPVLTYDHLTFEPLE